MSRHAARTRSASGGAPYLTLIPSPGSTGEAAEPADSTPAPRPVTDAEQHRRLSIAGSATVRALIAIGALVSAVGIPLEKADAVYKTHEVPDLVEADPGVSSLVNTAPATDVPTRTTTARTPVHASTAGQWTPAAKKTAVVATPALTPGSGRHRSPHPGLHKGWKNGGGHGKHRRQDGTPSQNGQHPHQTGRADKVELQQGVNQRGSFKIGLSVRVSTPLTGVLL